MQSKWISMFLPFKRYRKYLRCLPEPHSPLVWNSFFSGMPVYCGWTSWLQSGPHKYSMRERFPIFSTEMRKVDWLFWQIKETLSSFKFCLQLDSSWKLLGMTSLVMLTEAEFFWHWNNQLSAFSAVYRNCKYLFFLVCVLFKWCTNSCCSYFAFYVFISYQDHCLTCHTKPVRDKRVVQTEINPW